MHADSRDADDAIDVLDVALDIALDAVGMIRNLTDCQGP